MIAHMHTGIGDDGVQLNSNSIIVNSIVTGKLANGSVTTVKLSQVSGQQSIITSVIRDLAITTAKIKDTDVIASQKLRDSSVTTIKLQGGVSSPGNQTAYGKDVSGTLGFNLLSGYGTTIDTSANTIRLNNNATILQTITIPYAVNSGNLDGVPALGTSGNGVRCTDCTWCCTNACTWQCISCTGSCVNACSSTCATNCGGTCANTCGGGCAAGCTGSCQIGCSGDCAYTFS